MAQTGQLGRLDGTSRLGNIILGLSAVKLGITNLTGIPIQAVGTTYDFAIGFDPGVGTAQMYGYMVAPGQQWTEQTNLQDLDQLIQTDTSATTDKDLTHWPKVSQGDWTHGERQIIFVSNQQFYSSDGGLDFTKPNFVTVEPAANVTTYTSNGSFNIVPLASDNANWYLGLSTGATNFAIGSASGITLYSLGGGGEVFDVQSTVGGVFFGTGVGIWRVDPAGTTTQVTNDGLTQVPARSMAYFNNALYYITSSDTKINKVVTFGAGAGTTVISAGTYETHFSFVCSTAGGLLYGAWREWSTTSYSNHTVLYTFDGTTSNRIDEIPGQVKAVGEMNGIVYLLCSLAHPVDQPNPNDNSTPTDYTLYTFTPSGSGGSLAVIDDPRYLIGDFQASDPSPTAYVKGGIAGDGRFVYISWPGYQALRLDTLTSGLTHIAKGSGGVNVAGNAGHRTVATNTMGVINVQSSGTTVTVRQYNGASGSGQYITSYFDFNTPSVTKYFRSIDIELVYPLPAGAMVTVEYQLDSVTTWAAISPVPTLTNILTAYLPTGTKGSRVRFRITLVPGGGGSPILRSTSVRANLGRVWKTTATCKRHQQLRDGLQDIQGATGQDLIANIENTYANANKAILFVPSSKVSGGVEQVNAILEDYTIKQYTPTVRADDRGVRDMEAEIDLTFVESL